MKPNISLIYYIPGVEKIIASAGKSTISPKRFSEIYSEIKREDIEKWTVEIIQRGHSSPLEHSLYVFEITCSRVCSHQLVRHRIASYTQLSQRYSDKYLKKLVEETAEKLGIPVDETNSYGEYIRVLNEFLSREHDFNELVRITSEVFIIPPIVVKNKDSDYLFGLIKSISKYYELLEKGFSYEDARYVLPQCVKTRLVVSMNARELVEVFLPLRMCSRAQWEIRYIAWNMWRQLVNTHPEIFSYTGPRCIYFDLKTNNKTCSLKQYLERKCELKIERCPELVSREKIIDCVINSSRDPWSNNTLF